jgi:hypothetical protein
MRVAKTKSILPVMVMSYALLSFGSLGCAFGDEPAKAPVVPQTLLKLIHAPQVQQELGFRADDAALLAVLREVDGAWWRSRNLP